MRRAESRSVRGNPQGGGEGHRRRAGGAQTLASGRGKTFLTGITGERLYAPCLLSLMGLRPAEVCGLRWSDVDFEAGTIAAGENTRTLVDGEIEEKEAKSAAGKRGLPMPGTVAKALKAFHTLQKKERLKAGDVYVDSGYVLVNELGQPQRTDWLRRRVYELMAKVGVRKVRPYDARHACLTYLAGAGVPDVVLAAWAGHADGATLAKRVYVHPDSSHLKVAAEHLETGPNSRWAWIAWWVRWAGRVARVLGRGRATRRSRRLRPVPRRWRRRRPAVAHTTWHCVRLCIQWWHTQVAMLLLVSVAVTPVGLAEWWAVTRISRGT